MTVGMWSWKSKSSKECVTTHRPNGFALKMDGARAEDPYPAVAAMHAYMPVQAATSRRAVAVSAEASGAILGGAAASADLGGSSKYSNENFEGRSGEGFHVNSS